MQPGSTHPPTLSLTHLHAQARKGGVWPPRNTSLEGKQSLRPEGMCISETWKWAHRLLIWDKLGRGSGGGGEAGERGKGCGLIPLSSPCEFSGSSYSTVDSPLSVSSWLTSSLT